MDTAASLQRRSAVSEPSITIDLLDGVVRPKLLELGFEDAGHSGEGSTYAWVRFRRQERVGSHRQVRMITLSHAAEDSAFLADAYVVARATDTQTPTGREMRRYGDVTEATAAVDELAAAVLTWLGA